MYYPGAEYWSTWIFHKGEICNHFYAKMRWYNRRSIIYLLVLDELLRKVSEVWTSCAINIRGACFGHIENWDHVLTNECTHDQWWMNTPFHMRCRIQHHWHKRCMDQLCTVKPVRNDHPWCQKWPSQPGGPSRYYLSLHGTHDAQPHVHPITPEKIMLGRLWRLFMARLSSGILREVGSSNKSPAIEKGEPAASYVQQQLLGNMWTFTLVGLKALVG